MAQWYYPHLKSTIEYRPEVTWDELAAQYRRTPRSLRRTLNYHEQTDLVKRVDKASGVEREEPYLNRLLVIADSDEQVTWTTLSILLGKSRKQMSGVLYKHGHKDLVRRIDRATRYE